jgi:hypothetical protein
MSLHQGWKNKKTKKTGSGEREKYSENMRMSEFVVMRGMVHAVVG